MYCETSILERFAKIATLCILSMTAAKVQLKEIIKQKLFNSQYFNSTLLIVLNFEFWAFREKRTSL